MTKNYGITASEITPQEVFEKRRQLIKLAAAGAFGLANAGQRFALRLRARFARQRNWGQSPNFSARNRDPTPISPPPHAVAAAGVSSRAAGSGRSANLRRV